MANNGNRRFYARYSPSGRTANLVAATGGLTVAGDPSGLQVTNTSNLGQLQERTDGRITMQFIDDAATPQASRFLWTDNPEITPTFGRKVFDMAGVVGGTAQFYINSVADTTAANRQFVVMFIHPSIADQPVKCAWVDLSAGTVLQNVDTTPTTAGTGTIYDAEAGQAAMLGYDNAATVNVTTGSQFTRVHDVCAYGDFQARAIAVTRGATGATFQAVSHQVIWCAAGLNRSNSANWTVSSIGAGNRAQTWDNGGNRRYNSDIRFLPPRDGDAFRCAVVARDPTSTDFRIEVWGGANPGSVSLRGATPRVAASPNRPCRLFVSPGAATDAQQAMVYGFTGTYLNFNDFTPMTPFSVTYAVPTIITAPVATLTPSVGSAYTVTDGIWTEMPVVTSRLYQWQRSDDGVSGWADITGETAASYTPVSGDAAKFLRRGERAVNSVGTAAAFSYSNASAAVSAAFSPASVGNFIVFNPDVGITQSAGRVSRWGADTSFSGSSAGALAQATSGVQPLLVSSPFKGLQFSTTRNDRLPAEAANAILSFFQNRSATLIMVRLQRDADITSITRFPVFWSINGAPGTGSARHAIAMNVSEQYFGAIRRADGDGSTASSALWSAAINTTEVMTSYANYGTPPAQMLREDGADVGAGTAPSSGATTSNTVSTEMAIGAHITSVGVTFPGFIGGWMAVAKNSGSFTTGEVAALEAWFLANVPA